MISLNQLQNVEFDGIDKSDYPDFADAYVGYAEWANSGVELTESELMSIDGSEINQAVVTQVLGG